MNNRFDELAKSMAQSVTRRGALKKFGVGFAGIALATLGLANKAEAAAKGSCVHWHCVPKIPQGEPIDAYICGGGRPYPGGRDLFCEKIGPVACSYCSNCC